MVAAKVRFDPSDGSIIESINIDSITKNSTGNYTINYSSTFADLPFYYSITPYDTSGNILSMVLTDYRSGSYGSYTTTIECISAANVLGILTLIGNTDPTDEICFIVS